MGMLAKIPVGIYLLAIVVFGALALYGFFGGWNNNSPEINESLVTPAISQETINKMSAAEQAEYYAQQADANANEAIRLQKATDSKADDLKKILDDARTESDADGLLDYLRDARDTKNDIDDNVKEIKSLRDTVEDNRDNAEALADYREVNETTDDYQRKQIAFAAAKKSLTKAERAVTNVEDPQNRAASAFKEIETKYNSLTKPANLPAANETNKTVEIRYVYVPAPPVSTPAPAPAASVTTSNTAPLSMADIAAGGNGGSSSQTGPTSTSTSSGLSMADIANGG